MIPHLMYIPAPFWCRTYKKRILDGALQSSDLSDDSISWHLHAAEQSHVISAIKVGFAVTRRQFSSVRSTPRESMEGTREQPLSIIKLHYETSELNLWSIRFLYLQDDSRTLCCIALFPWERKGQLAWCLSCFSNREITGGIGTFIISVSCLRIIKQISIGRTRSGGRDIYSRLMVITNKLRDV